MKKRLVLYILLILWMGLIFYFSNQESIQSDNISNGIMDKAINILENIIDYDFNESQITNIYTYGIFPLRKLAHLSLYFVLGILFYLSIKNINRVRLSILLVMLYACTDEVHQLFVSGRSGEFRDVLIDTIGGIIGILLINKIKNRKKKGVI